MKRARPALLAAGMLLILATPAVATGVNLAWSECAGGGGSVFNNFGCDTNDGAQLLIASVVPPPGIDVAYGFETRIDLRATGSTFPDWWRLRNQTNQLNQCRNGTLSASSDFSGWSGCADIYRGAAAGGIGSYVVDQGSTSAHLYVVYSLPSALAGPLDPDAEYYTARITITNAKTIGNGACGGCMTPACISVSYIRCQAPGGGVSVVLTAISGTVGWHPVSWSDCGCAAVPQKIAGPSTCAVVCPAQKSTWGQLKSLYR